MRGNEKEDKESEKVNAEFTKKYQKLHTKFMKSDQMEKRKVWAPKRVYARAYTGFSKALKIKKRR